MEKNMSEKKYLDGVSAVRDFVCDVVLPKIPKPICEKQIRRLFKNGKLPCEPRHSELEPFRVDPSSLSCIVDPNCDVDGYGVMADYLKNKNYKASLRTIKLHRKRKEFPVDRLGGRVYSCTTSLDNYAEQYLHKKKK